MRPVGGWVKLVNSPVTGVPRGMLAWRQNDFESRLAIGTQSKLYVYSGGSVYDITPSGIATGRLNSFSGYGYGYGTYNNGDYGESQVQSISLQATTWSLDTWGQNLIACNVTDGKIYTWNNSPSSPATQLTNAPTDCAGIIVTPERHLVAYGAGGVGKKVAWCSSEDNTDWTATATNSAGELQLQTDGRILAAERVRGQIALLTETELHMMQYIGLPYVYSVQKVGSFCGLIGPKASKAIEGGMVWMSHNNFFVFDGTLRPIPCDVSDHVFGDINRVQAAKIAAGHNSKYGEVWWFYPSAASDEVDRYVMWNYRENHWSVGTLARTSWVDSGVYPYPIASDVNGYLYEHENGWTAAGSPLTTQRYAKSGPVEISNGDTIMHVRQILPDENSQGKVHFSCRIRYTPNGSETTYGPFTVAPYTDARLSGRQVALDVTGQADEDWRLGRVRLDAVAGGGR